MHGTKTSFVEPKCVVAWNQEELHMSNLNFQGLYILISSAITEDSALISMFTTSNKVWDLLINKYGGSSSQTIGSTSKMVVFTTLDCSNFRDSLSKIIYSTSFYQTDVGDKNTFSLQDSYDQLLYENLKLKNVMTKIGYNLKEEDKEHLDQSD